MVLNFPCWKLLSLTSSQAHPAACRTASAGESRWILTESGKIGRVKVSIPTRIFGFLFTLFECRRDH
jgi:hypothetical protein